MPLANSRVALLWWIAFAAETIAAVLETIERNYLKATGFYCLAVAFFILATGVGSNAPVWRKVLLYLLILTSIGLLVYRIAAAKFI